MEFLTGFPIRDVNDFNKVNYYINVKEFGAVGNGTTDDSDSIINALASTLSNTVVLPEGIYRINKNVTIPSNKKLIFASGAMLKPANGVTITINSTWEANPNHQIFDLSLNGVIGGDFKISEIYPEWLGAKGDGVTDDAKAFNDAMTLCAKKRVMILGAKTYLVKSTIENNARSIRGTARYVDSQQGGTLIKFEPTDTTTDLLPCIRIANAAYNGEFRDFAVQGNVSYTSKELAKWIDKTLFEQDKYEMFAAGVAAIEVAGTATPTFTNIQTGRCKVGFLLNSTNGHITSYDCAWSGLIAVYCRRNSGDYFFQGGTVSGAFCGIMMGIILEAGHYGGMGVTMNRVHMGFSPYGFYQVKDAPNYDSLQSVLGLSAHLISTRFERTGEAAIKLLPKSISNDIYVAGFGLTWSPLDYPEGTFGGWVCPIPDELLARNQKQKYAAYFGMIKDRVEILNQDYGGVFKSTAPGALGSAYIENLDGAANLVGLDVSTTVVNKKHPNVSLELTTPQVIESVVRTKHLNPISFGNLMNNPEDISNWKLIGTGTGELSMVTDLATLPVQFNAKMKRYIGDKVKVLKYSPDGTNSQMIGLYLPSNIVLDSKRYVCYEYFVFSPKGLVGSRLSSPSGYLYEKSYNVPTNDWSHIYGRGLKSDSLRQVEFYGLSATEPSYIVGVMVCYDELSPYSPYSHAYTTLPIETTSGVILNSESGSRYKLTINDGNISVTDLTNSSNDNVYATISKSNILPVANASQRGRVITLLGSDGVKEVASLNITSGCTANGDVIITLDGTPTSVSLTTAQNTSSLVASTIRAKSFPGWKTSGSGTNIIFTCETEGVCKNPTYSASSTGANGAITVTNKGINGTGDKVYVCKKLPDNSYDWSEV